MSDSRTCYEHLLKDCAKCQEAGELETLRAEIEKLRIRLEKAEAVIKAARIANKFSPNNYSGLPEALAVYDAERDNNGS